MSCDDDVDGFSDDADDVNENSDGRDDVDVLNGFDDDVDDTADDVSGSHEDDDIENYDDNNKDVISVFFKFLSIWSFVKSSRLWDLLNIISLHILTHEAMKVAGETWQRS